MKKGMLVTYLIFLSIFFLSACGNSTHKAVQGTWKAEHTKYIIKKDTIEYKYEDGDSDLYKYEVVNDENGRLVVDEWPKKDSKEDSTRAEWSATKKSNKIFIDDDQDGYGVEAYKEKETNKFLMFGIGVLLVLGVCYIAFKQTK
ncbi:hypothetical protein ACWEYI_00020 [Staphylococcus xylosus]|uniref:hypothetical protein n=1 Tax=Staphylococcus xylosus TaxID=1288 RepID=UPI00034B6EBD|nr:hypothetical protein [Staphylococcus xylosus]